MARFRARSIRSGDRPSRTIGGTPCETTTPPCGTTLARALAAAACVLACASARARGDDPADGGRHREADLPARCTGRPPGLCSRNRASTCRCSATRPAAMPKTGCSLAACKASSGFYDHTIDLQAKGKFVQSVVQFSQAPGEAVVVATHARPTHPHARGFPRPRAGRHGPGLVDAPADAVPGRASVRHQEGRGHDGERRFRRPVFAQALRDGRIDVGMTTEPTVSRLLKSGDAPLARRPAHAGSGRQRAGGQPIPRPACTCRRLGSARIAMRFNVW